SKSVATPLAVPFMTIDAPGKGTLFSSNTFPVKIPWEWPVINAKKANIITILVLFILLSLWFFNYKLSTNLPWMIYWNDHLLLNDCNEIANVVMKMLRETNRKK